VKAGTAIEPVVDISRGRVEITSARPLASVNGIRAMFDVVPDESAAPVTLRLYLRSGGAAVSETWLCEWTPPAPAERRLTRLDNSGAGA
jgi:glucans biosynthesis protein